MSGHIHFPGLPGFLPQLEAVGTLVPPCTHGVGENVKKYTMIDGGQEIDIVTGTQYCTLIRDAKTNNLIALDDNGIFTLVDNDGISIRFKEHNYNPHPHPHPRHAFKKSRSKKSRSKKSKKSKGSKNFYNFIKIQVDFVSLLVLFGHFFLKSASRVPAS